MYLPYVFRLTGDNTGIMPHVLYNDLPSQTTMGLPSDRHSILTIVLMRWHRTNHRRDIGRRCHESGLVTKRYYKALKYFNGDKANKSLNNR